MISNAVLLQDSPTPEPLFLPNIPSALFYKHLRLLSAPALCRYTSTPRRRTFPKKRERRRGDGTALLSQTYQGPARRIVGLLSALVNRLAAPNPPVCPCANVAGPMVRGDPGRGQRPPACKGSHDLRLGRISDLPVLDRYLEEGKVW